MGKHYWAQIGHVGKQGALELGKKCSGPWAGLGLTKSNKGPLCGRKGTEPVESHLRQWAGIGPAKSKEGPTWSQRHIVQAQVEAHLGPWVGIGPTKLKNGPFRGRNAHI